MTCSKRRYRSEADALTVLVNAKIRAALHGSTKRRECRAYRCPDCSGAWHLTSRPLAQSA